MVLTERDLNLFRKLSSYGMLTTKQIALNVFQSIATTTVLRRLRILEAGYLIKRIIGLETHENLWILTEKGAGMADVPLAKRNWSKNLLEHDHKLLSLRLELEKFGIAHSWTPEHEIRSMIISKYGIREAKKKLIPDGLMISSTQNKKVPVAIELELTLKSQSRIKQIVKRYQVKKDLQAVWYISNSKSILKSVFREWINNKDLNKSILLYGSLLEEVLKNSLDAQLWSETGILKVKDIWTPAPAHSPAQNLSRHLRSPNQPPPIPSQENHLDKDESLSCKIAVSTTDLPLPTLLRV